MTPLKKNLAVIQQHHPELLPLLQQPISTSHLTVIPTKNGAAQLVVTTKDGQTQALHDPQNPLGPIQRMATQISKQHSGVRVILGFELGYLAKFLCCDLPSNAALVFYEADPAIFLIALNVVDLTDVLSHPRVAIHVGPKAILRQSCSVLLEKFGGPLHTTVYGPALNISPSVYQEKIQKDLSNIFPILQSAQRIVEWDGALLTENILKNMPHVLRSPSAMPLRDVWKNIPATLIAAGPSLQKNVMELKKAKGHAVLIAADSALKSLLENGVIPDFVVSVDPQALTSQKYEGVDVPQEVTLVFHPATHHQLVKQFPGHTLTMDVPLPAFEWLKQHWESKGQFDQEATCQIQVGFNFAAWIGCNPLVLVGHDLCFTDDGMHVSSTSYLPEHAMDEITRHAQNIPTGDGRIVKTTPTLANDKIVLEKKIRDFPGSVINATEGGLDIVGSLACPFSEVLSKFEQPKTIEVYPKIHRLHVDMSPLNVSAIRSDIQARLRDVFRFERTARHVFRLLTKMKDHRARATDLPPSFLQLGHKVEKLTSLMTGYVQAQTLLDGMNPQLSSQFDLDSLSLQGESDPQLKIDRQIERGLRYYSGVLAITPLLRDWLGKLVDRLTAEFGGRLN